MAQRSSTTEGQAEHATSSSSRDEAYSLWQAHCQCPPLYFVSRHWFVSAFTLSLRNKYIDGPFTNAHSGCLQRVKTVRQTSSGKQRREVEARNSTQNHQSISRNRHAGAHLLGSRAKWREGSARLDIAHANITGDLDTSSMWTNSRQQALANMMAVPIEVAGASGNSEW